MKIENNVSLKKYTTLNIGGIAEKFYIIEEEKDLYEISEKIKKEHYVIANGSNLLINDKKIFRDVIYMNKLENKLEEDENGIIEASASIKIQQLINFANKREKGGLEYLYSVPATVGGAIYMNAGRGKVYNKKISDYVVDVKIFDGDKVRVLKNEECNFLHRDSIFKKNNWIILSARFKFPYMSKEEGDKLKKERLDFSKNNLDANNKNAGSVFKSCNGRIMRLLKKLNLGWKNGVSFSKKTGNWMNNNGNGTYRQAKFLINLTIFLHKIMFRNIELEYIDWK